MSITLTALMKQRYDTAANWTTANPTLLAGEIGIESDTKKWKLGTGSTAWTSLGYIPGLSISAYPLVNADIASNAEIAVSKLADGAARQLLQTDAAGTGVEWASNIDIPGTLDVTGAATFDAAVTTTGLISADGKVSFPLGTAALPSLHPGTDTNTGIYSPGADQVAISTNGTGRLTVSTTAVSSTLAVDHPLGAVGTPSITFTGDLNTGFWSPAADTLAASTGGSERLRILSDGRVGLGTSAPSVLLHLKGTGTGTGGQVEGSATSDYTFLQVFNPSGVQGQITANGNTDLQLRGVSNHPLSFYTNNTERLRITAAGNVGIGTTSPSTLLQCYGGISGIDTRVTVGNAATALNLGVDSSNAVTIGTNQNQPFYFVTNGSERARIDSSGRLLVGTSTSRNSDSNGTQYSAQLQIESASAGGIAVSRFTDSTAVQSIALQKARGTAATPVVVNSGDSIGNINFSGHDGTIFVNAARVSAEVDGTPGANDMPGRLVFSTTADGAATPTERLRITSAGVLQVADASNITVGTTTGTKIGTATTQKLGFYNATPVVQPAAVANATDATTVITQLNDLLAKLRTLGIIAT
jgi:hypothetical protein